MSRPPQILAHEARDVYDAPGVKLARLEHDFIDGFAQMFDCPRALLRSGAKDTLLDCLRKCYPHLKRSKVRMFLEGSMTEGESNSLQTHHRRRRDMVLLFCDLVETLYATQYQSRVKQSAIKSAIKIEGVAAVKKRNNDAGERMRAGRERKRLERVAAAEQEVANGSKGAS